MVCGMCFCRLQRFFLWFLLHALSRDLMFCVSNGLQKQAGLIFNTSGAEEKMQQANHARNYK
jgi:hypothetical protein